jgi:hypothetical protein
MGSNSGRRMRRRQKGEAEGRRQEEEDTFCICCPPLDVAVCVFTVGRVRGKKAMATGEAAFEISGLKTCQNSCSPPHTAPLSLTPIVLTVCGVGFENAWLDMADGTGTRRRQSSDSGLG